MQIYNVLSVYNFHFRMSLLSTASTDTPSPALPQEDGYYNITLAKYGAAIQSLIYVERVDGALVAYKTLLGGDLGDRIGTLKAINNNTLWLVRNNGRADAVATCRKQRVRPLTRSEREALYNVAASARQPSGSQVPELC